MPFDAQISAAAADRIEPNPRPIAVWLLAVAGMVWVMVAIGGATRLTGSGLSIMEWAPLSGTLPPLSEAEWRRLYDLYRSIPQYALVNAGFGIEGFKEIFWLEWIHRFWGRLIGLAYAVPLAWFWLRGRIPAGLKPRLVLLLLLGGLQGAVGWFMVASGFEADRTAVSPYRLVMHLGLALVLFAALLWTGLSVLRPVPAPAVPGQRTVRRQAQAAAWLIVAAMLAGGFVAGTKAGFDYNTFPLMAGRLVPEGYWRLDPAWTNLTVNIAAVQFNHRLLATLATLAALGAAFAGWRRLPAGPARRACLGLGFAVCLQYALGVATLVHVVPVWLGTLHQACAVLVLAAALAALHALRYSTCGKSSPRESRRGA
ncbi:COX15/CtaA family protein [Paracraurococcus ruber]|uniref:Heme A synthase n=1 Tax=Paracraurococcus ruber TaxID=77675 RepID=A0ABS1D2J0_9PROT|nr:COX15/CtaA family protein [Paracraurococcus ruber]MBK1661004.1 heme A synthase [Paracraurococcus ruber]TDG32619.1 heme A synthase [Paracraurococcus ruber]